MPAAMSLAPYQIRDTNMRNAYHAHSSIFRTQATEVERATGEAQQRKWHMKKRLNDMLLPLNAVLSHAVSPAKAKSLNQARGSGGHTKVSFFPKPYSRKTLNPDMSLHSLLTATADGCY